jgi:hypothetical protein
VDPDLAQDKLEAQAATLRAQAADLNAQAAHLDAQAAALDLTPEDAAEDATEAGGDG